MAPISPKNVLVQIFSITGALVASFYNNTEGGENLRVICNEKRIGGLDQFSFTIPSTTTEPLFSDMECRIFVNGDWWYSGFADFIPNLDTYEPVINVEGRGFFHKLEEKIINRSYTAQTLDFIIKDVAANELGEDINVFYDVSKISVPVLAGISIEFDDQSLTEVFEQLLGIANFQYTTQQYTFGVDKEKNLYFSPISNDLQKHLYEGYNYQFPDTSKLGKIINQIRAYRAPSAGAKTAEFVATYSDAGSVELNGLFEKKITFPNYADTTTIASIAQGILEKNAEPLDRVEIENLEISEQFPIGFYGLSNRRDKYFLTVNDMEDISDWDVSGLNFTVATISSEEVFTGRRAMKLVTSPGSAGDMLSYTLPIPIKFPDIFRLFVLLTESTGALTVRLIDSNNNTVDISFGGTGDQSGEWIKRLVPVSLLLNTDDLIVDYDLSTSDDLIVDYDLGTSDNLTVDTLVREGITDIVKVEIIIDSDVATTMYIDALSVQANTYLRRNIILEEIEYDLSKSYLAKGVFGTKIDSVIDEIKKDVKDGNIALSIFSKS